MPSADSPESPSRPRPRRRFGLAIARIVTLIVFIAALVPVFWNWALLAHSSHSDHPSVTVSLNVLDGSPLAQGHPTDLNVAWWQQADQVSLCLVVQYEYPAALDDPAHWNRAAGDPSRTPQLSVLGGEVLGYSDPFIRNPPNNDIEPGQLFLASLDMATVDWKMFKVPFPGSPSVPFTTNMPAVVHGNPVGPPGPSGSLPPAIVWDASCVLMKADSYHLDDFASATFEFQWGDSAQTVWPRSSAETTARFSYHPLGDSNVTAIEPHATESNAFEHVQEFPYNSVFDSRVTYTTPWKAQLLSVSIWIAEGAGAAALSLWIAFLVSGRQKRET